jgi:hypothetical protein
MHGVATSQKKEAVAALLLACACTALMAFTHLVEVMILILMCSLNFVVQAFTIRSLKPVILAATWLIISVAASLVVLRYYYSGFPMPLNTQMELDSYWPFFSQMFEYYISVKVFIIFVISLFILGCARASVSVFLLCCCATAIIFSPINALLFGTLIHFVGGNLVWRTIFVLPTYLAIGAALVVVSRSNNLGRLMRFEKRGLFSLVWILSAAGAIALHLVSWWHLDGSLGYQHSDAVSQLRLFPNLYRELANYKGEVVLSDTITSAPINAISSNFIVTHRPWTEGLDAGRFGVAKETLRHPATDAARDAICRMKITLFVVNTAELPSKLKTETQRYSWLRDDFYESRDAYKKVSFLQFRGEFDGVDIYLVDRSMLCKLPSPQI